MDNRQMIKGAWAFVLMMVAVTLGAFALTATCTLLSLLALHMIEATQTRHVVLTMLLLVAAAALVTSRQRTR